MSSDRFATLSELERFKLHMLIPQMQSIFYTFLHVLTKNWFSRHENISNFGAHLFICENKSSNCVRLNEQIKNCRFWTPMKGDNLSIVPSIE